jgi:phage capsid family
MTDKTALEAGTLYPPQLVKELFSKVKGKSVLAKVSKQDPVPQEGNEFFVFNLEGNAQIVGEGEQVKAGKATIAPKVVRPYEITYQARVSDKFLTMSEEKKIDFLAAFNEGFAKKLAEAIDIAAIHGLEPKSMTDGTFKATNSFDGQITTNVVTYAEANIEDNIDSAANTVTVTGGVVNGIIFSPQATHAMSKVKENGITQYPEFKFGQCPEVFAGMIADSTKNMIPTGTNTAEKDHVIVGDFENSFKWGYADSISLEVIQYGDPDGAGRDLKAHNEVCLRTKANVGWGILDETAFARVKEA